MSAPNEKADGSRSDAHSLSVVRSYRLLPKKTYLGRTAPKKRIGANTAASLAFEKKTETRRQNETCA